jgi:hypothetical protein
MQFATFGHYCTERLGMSARTVEQRAWLARRFFFLPGLKEAMREGRVSYEKARLIARCAGDKSIASWIERAEGLTCIALRREIEAHEATQMRAQGALDARVPRRVANLMSAAFRAVREAVGRWVSPGDCLEIIARHFLETWKGEPCDASDAAGEGDRARPGLLPGPGLQPGGGACAPHPVPLGRRLRRTVEPHRPVCGTSPRRRAPRVPSGAGAGTGPARLGDRAREVCPSQGSRP